MRRADNPQVLEQAFNVLVQAAVTGVRCPENETHGIYSDVLTELARQGRIKVEISGNHYRTVTILTGDHAGMCTKRDRAVIRKVIDRNGAHKPGGFPIETGNRKRTQPSAPRILKGHEL